jgi:hypothetical protein
MRRGDRVLVRRNGPARDARSERPYAVYAGTRGTVVEMTDRRFHGVARVELDIVDYTGQELLIGYDLIELVPGYATPSRA